MASVNDIQAAQALLKDCTAHLQAALDTEPAQTDSPPGPTFCPLIAIAHGAADLSGCMGRQCWMWREAGPQFAKGAGDRYPRGWCAFNTPNLPGMLGMPEFWGPFVERGAPELTAQEMDFYTPGDPVPAKEPAPASTPTPEIAPALPWRPASEEDWKVAPPPPPSPPVVSEGERPPMLPKADRPKQRTNASQPPIMPRSSPTSSRRSPQEKWIVVELDFSDPINALLGPQVYAADVKATMLAGLLRDLGLKLHGVAPGQVQGSSIVWTVPSVCEYHVCEAFERVLFGSRVVLYLHEHDGSIHVYDSDNGHQEAPAEK